MPSSIGFLHSPIPKPDFEYSQTVNNRESWRVADSQRPSSQGSTHRIIDPSQHNSHHKSHRESHHNHNHSSKHHGERHHRNSTLRYSKIVSTGRIEEYDILRDMGDGSFGSVVQAERKGTGEMVAIKKMKKTFNSWEDCLKLRELRSLKCIPGHEYIIPLYDAFISTKTRELYFVFEYMDGNLYQLMKQRRGNKFTQGLTRSILYQMLAGLEHIHAHGYFHRDMKPENLLISARGNKEYATVSGGVEQDVDVIVKLADFGLAREIKSRPPYTEYVSTRWYRAPEVLLRSTSYNAPVDLWAIGVMLVELVNLKPLFPGQSEIDQIERICEVLGYPAAHTDAKGRAIGGGEWKDGLKMAKSMGFSFPQRAPIPLASVYPSNVPSSLVHLTHMLLRYDPKARPTTASILAHPYFTAVGIIHKPRQPVEKRRTRGDNMMKEFFKKEQHIVANEIDTSGPGETTAIKDFFQKSTTNGVFTGDKIKVSQATIAPTRSRPLPEKSKLRRHSLIDGGVEKLAKATTPPPSVVTHRSSQLFPGNNTEAGSQISAGGTISKVTNDAANDAASSVAAVDDPHFNALPLIRGMSPIRWSGPGGAQSRRQSQLPATSAEAMALASASQPGSPLALPPLSGDYFSIMPGIEEATQNMHDSSEESDNNMRSPSRVFSSPAEGYHGIHATQMRRTGSVEPASARAKPLPEVGEDVLETLPEKDLAAPRHYASQVSQPSAELPDPVPPTPPRKYSLPDVTAQDREDALSALLISGDASPSILGGRQLPELTRQSPSPARKLQRASTVLEQRKQALSDVAAPSQRPSPPSHHHSSSSISNDPVLNYHFRKILATDQLQQLEMQRMLGEFRQDILPSNKGKHSVDNSEAPRHPSQPLEYHEYSDEEPQIRRQQMMPEDDYLRGRKLSEPTANSIPYFPNQARPVSTFEFTSMQQPIEQLETMHESSIYGTRGGGKRSKDSYRTSSSGYVNPDGVLALTDIFTTRVSPKQSKFDGERSSLADTFKLKSSRNKSAFESPALSPSSPGLFGSRRSPSMSDNRGLLQPLGTATSSLMPGPPTGAASTNDVPNTGRKSLAATLLRKDRKGTGAGDDRRTSKLWSPVSIFSSKGPAERDDFGVPARDDFGASPPASPPLGNGIGLPADFRMSTRELSDADFEPGLLSVKEQKKREKKERKLHEKMIKDEEKERQRLIKEAEKERVRIAKLEHKERVNTAMNADTVMARVPAGQTTLSPEDQMMLLASNIGMSGPAGNAAGGILASTKANNTHVHARKSSTSHTRSSLSSDTRRPSMTSTASSGGGISRSPSMRVSPMSPPLPSAQTRVIVKPSSKPVGTYRTNATASPTGTVAPGGSSKVTPKYPDHIAIPLPGGGASGSNKLSMSPPASDIEDFYYVTTLPVSPVSPTQPSLPSPRMPYKGSISPSFQGSHNVYSMSNATDPRSNQR